MRPEPVLHQCVDADAIPALLIKVVKHFTTADKLTCLQINLARQYELDLLDITDAAVGQCSYVVPPNYSSTSIPLDFLLATV